MCKCQGCTKRYVGCHSDCLDYKDFRKEKDKINASIEADKNEWKYAWDSNYRYLNSYIHKSNIHKQYYGVH